MFYFPRTQRRPGHAGLKAAAYNVRINLPSIDDEDFHGEIRGRLDSLFAKADDYAREVEALVEEALEGMA